MYVYHRESIGINVPFRFLAHFLNKVTTGDEHIVGATRIMHFIAYSNDGCTRAHWKNSKVSLSPPQPNRASKCP